MKNNNQKGIAHHLLIIGLAVLVVASSFAGWRFYQSRKFDAQASGWTTRELNGVKLLTCTNKMGSGRVQIKVRVFNGTKYTNVIETYLNAYGSGAKTQKFSQTVAPGKWGTISSKYYHFDPSQVIDGLYYGPTLEDYFIHVAYTKTTDGQSGSHGSLSLSRFNTCP